MKLVGVSWNVASSMQIIVVDRLASSQMACHHLAIAACDVFLRFIPIPDCFLLIALHWVCNFKSFG
jgi:hypothetical protein